MPILFKEKKNRNIQTTRLDLTKLCPFLLSLQSSFIHNNPFHLVPSLFFFHFDILDCCMELFNIRIEKQEILPKQSSCPFSPMIVSFDELK